MSGLVRTYSACSRAQSRCSRGESPSWVVASSPGSPRLTTASSWSWARALGGAEQSADPEADHSVQLVLGEGLGGRDVQRGGSTLTAAAAGGLDLGKCRE